MHAHIPGESSWQPIGPPLPPQSREPSSSRCRPYGPCQIPELQYAGGRKRPRQRALRTDFPIHSTTRRRSGRWARWNATILLTTPILRPAPVGLPALQRRPVPQPSRTRRPAPPEANVRPLKGVQAFTFMYRRSRPTGAFPSLNLSLCIPRHSARRHCKPRRCTASCRATRPAPASAIRNPSNLAGRTRSPLQDGCASRRSRCLPPFARKPGPPACAFEANAMRRCAGSLPAAAGHRHVEWKTSSVANHNQGTHRQGELP